MLERFETSAPNEDGKLNISGDLGNLLPPHWPDGPVSGVAVVARRIQFNKPLPSGTTLKLNPCRTNRLEPFVLPYPDRATKLKSRKIELLFTIITQSSNNEKQCIDVNIIKRGQVKLIFRRVIWIGTTWRQCRWAIITTIAAITKKINSYFWSRFLFPKLFFLVITMPRL